MLGNIVGKLGDVVFTQNRYGPMVRIRAVPVQARTPRRSTARARLSAASALYRSTICPLGHGPAWIGFAANFAYRGTKGQPGALMLTGQAFSVGINDIRYLLDLPATLVPPDDWGSFWPDPNQSVNSLEAICVPGSSLLVRMNPAPFNITDCGVIIRATPPLPGGFAGPRKDSWRTISTLSPIAFSKSAIPVTGSPARSAINTNTNQVFCVSPGSNVCNQIDGTTHAVTPLATGSYPIACSADDFSNCLFVANRDDNSCNVIPFSGPPPHTVPTGLTPVAICTVTHTLYRAASANQGDDSVTLIPPIGAPANVATGVAPSDIACMSGTNLLYVACPGDSSVHRISPVTLVDTPIAMPNPCQFIAVNSVTNKIYALAQTFNTLFEIDGVTLAITPVATSNGPIALAVNTATNKIYVACALANAIDCITAPALTVTTIPAGTTPCAVAVNTATNRIYVTNSGSDDVSVINGVTDTAVLTGVGLAPSAAVCNPLSNLTYISDTGETLVTEINGAIYDSYFPDTLDVTAEYIATFGTIPGAGEKFFVEAHVVRLRSIAGADTAYVMQPIQVQAQTFGVLSSPIPVGTSPAALAVNPATNKIYVANSGSANFTIIFGETNHTATYAAASGPADVHVNVTGGKAYTACAGTDKVAVFNPANGSVTLVTVAANVFKVVCNHVTNKAYAICTGGLKVYEIDGVTNTVTAITVHTDTLDIAVNTATDKVYASCGATNCIDEIDGPTRAVYQRLLGFAPLHIAMNEVTNQLWITTGPGFVLARLTMPAHTLSSSALTTSTNIVAVNSVTDHIFVGYSGANGIADFKNSAGTFVDVATPGTCLGLSVNSVTNKVYTANGTVNGCSEVDGLTHAITAHLTGSDPRAVAVNETTGLVYVANFADNTVTVI